MVARPHFLFYVMWLGFCFSPFALLIPLILLRTNPWLFLAAVFLVRAGSTYLFLAIGRHWRRRIMQSQIRAQALTEPKPFVLISRSYDQSKVMTTGVSIPAPGVVETDIAMFEALVYDLSHEYPVVVLGDRDLNPNDSASRALYVGAWPEQAAENSNVFNVETGEFFPMPASWEEVFLSLAQRARHVLLIPSNSEGLTREIALLRSNLLGTKTVVYMWPDKGGHPNGAICGSPAQWEELRAPLAICGLNLPAHSRQGALLHLAEDFSVRAINQPLAAANLLGTVDADDSGTAAVALRAVAPMIEAYELMGDIEKFESMWAYARRWQKPPAY